MSEKGSFLKRVVSGGSWGCCCCDPQAVGVRQIDVGGSTVGIKDLDEVFQRFLGDGKKPKDLDGDELVEELGKINYIAEARKEAYKDAFLREYRRFYESKKG